MNFRVIINKTFNKGDLKGFATLVIDEKIYITGFKIIEKHGRLYAFYGSRKDKQGKYKDIYFITDKELRQKIYRMILVEYQQYINFNKIDRC